MTGSTMTPEQFLRVAAYVAIMLGAGLLIFRTATIRRKMGWGFSRTIGAVLTDGMMFFAIVVLVVGGISLLRYYNVGVFAGEQGRDRATWAFLGSLVLFIWGGYFRLEYWYSFGSREDDPWAQQSSLSAELRATRTSIDHLLAHLEGPGLHEEAG